MCNVDQPFKREPRWNAEPLLRIQGIRHASEFGNSRFGQFLEEVTPDVDKPRLDPPIFRFSARLFGIQPGHNMLFGNHLRGMHCVSPKLRAVASRDAFERFRKLRIRLSEMPLQGTIFLCSRNMSDKRCCSAMNRYPMSRRDTFRFGNRLPQALDALLGFLNRAQQGLFLFRNDR